MVANLGNIDAILAPRPTKAPEAAPTGRYAQFFDYKTFVALAQPQHREFLEFFAFSRTFQAFLEARLSQKLQYQGAFIDSFGNGQHYFTKSAYNSLVCGSNSLALNLGYSATNMSTGKSFRQTIDFSVNPNKSSESRTESPLTCHSDNDEEVDAKLQYQSISNDADADLADLLLRVTCNDVAPEDRSILKAQQCQFQIKKRATKPAEWNERTIVVYNGQQIMIEWKEQDKVKGRIALHCDPPVVADPKPDHPTAFVVSVFGKIEEKGREMSKKLDFAFNSAEDQHRFLVLCRQHSRQGAFERIGQHLVENKILNERKARRLAIGALQGNMDLEEDVLDWIFQFGDIK